MNSINFSMFFFCVWFNSVWLGEYWYVTKIYRNAWWAVSLIRRAGAAWLINYEVATQELSKLNKRRSTTSHRQICLWSITMSWYTTTCSLADNNLLDLTSISFFSFFLSFYKNFLQFFFCKFSNLNCPLQQMNATFCQIC